MKKLYSTIMMLAMMVVAVSITACGGDDDEGGGGSSSSEGWQVITDDFDKSIPFTKIRVLNKKASIGSYCCIAFSTVPNKNVYTDRYYVSFGVLTIGDNMIHDLVYGIPISSCTHVGDNWYEYEFSRPVYFAYYQENCPRGQIKAYITDVGGNNSDTGDDTNRDSKSGQSFSMTVRGVTFKMVGVSGGTFQMGSNDDDAYSNEMPVHWVTLSDFSIGETEVTWELWRAVMERPSTPLHLPKKPLNGMGWDDCQEFITKLNSLTGRQFRLPTEAEWEYAARGGNKSQGYKYAGSNTIGDVAWYSRNSSQQIHEVATKAPNELGLYDMSGNVHEWCNDWYDRSYYSSSPSSNPIGPTSGVYRVFRGGCWSLEAWSVSRRSGIEAWEDMPDLGLRLAL